MKFALAQSPQFKNDRRSRAKYGPLYDQLDQLVLSRVDNPDLSLIVTLEGPEAATLRTVNTLSTTVRSYVMRTYPALEAHSRRSVGDKEIQLCVWICERKSDDLSASPWSEGKEDPHG